MQRYEDLFVSYRLDDWSAAEDAHAMAACVRRFIQRRGFAPSLNHEQLTRQIIRYIWLRQRSSTYDISAPRHSRVVPDGWTSNKQSIWLDAIDMKCNIDDWGPEVIAPVFGNDVRTWEAYCSGWRNELFSFLPYWIEISSEQFNAMDPTPLPDPVPEETDPRLAKIDPYLLEHGRRGRRIKGVRTFD